MAGFIKPTGNVIKTNIEEPIGSIKQWGSNSIPSNWMICDGSPISRATYSQLFAIVGTTYGVGDGSTTFNLPDFRAASAVGSGTSTGYTQNETINLGSKNDDQMQGHTHQTSQAPESQGGTGALRAALTYNGTDLLNSNGPPVVSGSNGTPRTGNTTRGKVVGVHYIIKVSNVSNFGTPTDISAIPFSQEIIGLRIANNSTDSANDIDFIANSVCRFWDSTLTKVIKPLAGTFTKRLDAVWASGTNQGGRFFSTLTNGMTVHLFCIWQPNGTYDYGFDDNINATNRPGAYTYYRRVLSLKLTAGATTFPAFLEDNGSIQIAPTTVTTTAPMAWTAVTLPVPTGIRVRPKISVEHNNGASTSSGGVTKLSELSSGTIYNQITYGTYISGVGGAIIAYGKSIGEIRTSTSGVIYYITIASGAVIASFGMYLYGWFDDRIV